MKFIYEERPTIPRLAWCARLRKDKDFVTVFHGPWVETRATFFCEGAWNGDFAEGKLDEATVFMGSGGVSHKKNITFASPTHFVEKLYLIREKDEVFVSNSLAFILAETKDACAPTYLNYHYDLIDFHSRGFHRHHTTVPTAHRKKVHLYQRCNILVSQDLNIEIHHKQAVEQPENFSQYFELLRNSTREINDNALSSFRKRTYPSIATVSSGYDSTACAVLAKEVGCKEAVTIVTARREEQWGNDLDDSGTKIAESLKLSVREYDRIGYEKHTNFPEAEFCACGFGEDMNLLAMEEALAGRMVFTGTRGDFVWERLGYSVPWLNAGSFGVTEFRLRIGYLHMIPISIGEEFHQLITNISNSSDMKYWSVRSYYDRPIPRRIAEEAGIPRSFFGQEKKATSHDEIWGAEGMSEASALDFQNFIRVMPKERKRLQNVQFGLGRFLFRLNSRGNKIVNAVTKIFGKELELYNIFSQRYKKPPSSDDLTFHWGQEKIANRYK